MMIFSHEIIIFLCRISSFSLCFFRQWRHYITTYAELIWLSADFPDGLTFVYDQVNIFYYFNQHGFGIRSKRGKYNQTRKCHLPILSFSWVILFYTELTLFSTTWLDLVLLGAGWSWSKLCVCVRGWRGWCGCPVLHPSPTHYLYLKTCTRKERLGMLNSLGHSKLTSPDFICGRNWHDTQRFFMSLEFMKYHYYTPLANQTKIEKKANRFLFSFALTPGELLGVRFPGCDGGGVSFAAVRRAPIYLGTLFSTLTFNQTKSHRGYFLVIGWWGCAAGWGRTSFSRLDWL